MESGDGLSFGEFSYPVLQAYDWWHMYNTFQMNGIQIQIGGSDQYGNIMAGIEAINYIRKNHYDPDVKRDRAGDNNKPMGFTVPLLTTSSGEKFGKSAGNAVWLDKDMTSPFDLYQVRIKSTLELVHLADDCFKFFLRSSDEDVTRYLKLFTFMPLKDIEAVVAEHTLDPSKRIAQRQLAREVLSIVHGEQEVEAVEAQHGLLFRPSKNTAKRETKVINSDNQSTGSTSKVPDMNFIFNKAAGPNTPAAAGNVTLPKSLVVSKQIGRILYAAGLVSSRSEGHRLSAAKGAYIGSLPGQSGDMPDHVEFTPALNWEDNAVNKFIIDGKLLILRVGKWKVKIIRIVEDDEFERLGLNAPGWEEVKREREEKAREENSMSVKKIIRE